MKAIAPLVLCMNVAAASMSEIAIETPRRAQEDVNSNDKIDYLSFQKYNTEGMFLDWTGPSAFTSSLSATVVEYDYDAYIEAGSDKTVVLASIQNRLLRFVGEDVFEGGNTEQSEGLAIKEINTAPGDQPSSSTPCAIEADFPANTECMAVHGAMTVFYSSSGSMKNDEEAIDTTIKAAVKKGMDTNVAVTDSTKAVYYIGDRDSFDYTKEMFMLNNSKSQSQPSFWDRGGELVVGLSSAVFVVLMLLLCCKMRKSRSSEKADLSAFDEDIEIGHEITTQKSMMTEKSKKSVMSVFKETKQTETEVDTDDSATHKYGTCCWN